MKKLILIFALLFAVNLQAQKHDPQEVRNMCQSIGATAEMIMKARQGGVSIDRMIEIAAEGEELQELMYELILEAYDYPHVTSERVVENVIREFKNKTFLDCVRIFRE